MARWAIALLVVLFYVGHCWWSGRAIARPPGVLAPNDPVQELVADGPRWELDGVQVHALARFELEARVLSAQRYRLGREAELAPVDLAVGWGPMSSNEVIETLHISQSGRFYFYSWSSQSDLKASVADIARHSANMHMVPLDSIARETLLQARAGNLVHVSGWLVEAQSKDGWRWRSSLTRNDSGAGACELVAVENVSLE